MERQGLAQRQAAEKEAINIRKAITKKEKAINDATVANARGSAALQHQRNLAAEKKALEE